MLKSAVPSPLRMPASQEGMHVKVVIAGFEIIDDVAAFRTPGRSGCIADERVLPGAARQLVVAAGAIMPVAAIHASAAPVPKSALSRTMALRSAFEVAGRLFFALAIALTPISTASVSLQATPLIVAMRTGEVSAVTPFRYSRLVFAMLIGKAVFGERPDAQTFLGAAISVACGLGILVERQRIS